MTVTQEAFDGLDLSSVPIVSAVHSSATNEVKCPSGGLSLYFMSPPSAHFLTHLALIAYFKNLSASA